MSFYPLSESELRDWAYRPDAFQGLAQDAELLVASLHDADAILEFAADDRCPTQRFFINCVCLKVGERVRGTESAVSSGKEPSNTDILAFLRKAEKTGNAYLLEIVWRARALLDDPSGFDDEQWCAGGLVRELYLD